MFEADHGARFVGVAGGVRIPFRRAKDEPG